MTNSSIGIGIMAAFAVSGSVVYIASQFHKRLVSDFMNKIEFEINRSRKSCSRNNRRVRFTEESRICRENKNKEEGGDILNMENIINKKKISCDGNSLDTMPENRRVLYLGILKSRGQLSSAM